MANIIYNTFKKKIFDGSAVLTTATIKAMLVNSSYIADPDHNFVDSGAGSANPKTNELVHASYSRKTLATKTANQDNTNNLGYFDCDDITWPALTGVTAAAVIFFVDLGGVDTANPLVAFFDSGFPKTPAGSDLLVQIASTGLIAAA